VLLIVQRVVRMNSVENSSMVVEGVRVGDGRSEWMEDMEVMRDER
jgi:hypothetical protein